MFKAMYISSRKGTSKKSGKEYYQATVIAETIDNGNEVCQFFCDESTYNKFCTFQKMQNIRIMVGVNSFGNFAIKDVKEVD